MAVYMNANSSFRSDFMFNDNTSQRNSVNVGAQTTGNFSEMLNSIGRTKTSSGRVTGSTNSTAGTGSTFTGTAKSSGSKELSSGLTSKPTGTVNSSGSVNVNSDVNTNSADNSQREIVVVIRDVKYDPSGSGEAVVSDEEVSIKVDFIGEVSGNGGASAAENGTLNADSTLTAIPEDDLDLAEMLLMGKVKLEDIPVERLTPKLLKMIAVVAKFEQLQKGENGEDGKAEELKSEKKNIFDKDVFDPTEALKLIQAFSEMIDDQMLSAVYKVIEDYQEAKSEATDKVTMLDRICEALPEFPELERAIPFPVGEEKKEEEPEDRIMQIIDRMIESIKAAEIEDQNQARTADLRGFGNVLEQNTVGSAENTADIPLDAEKFAVLENALKNGEIGEVSVKTAEKPNTAEVSDIARVSEGTGKTDKNGVRVADDLDDAQTVKFGDGFNAQSSEKNVGSGNSSEQSRNTVSEELEMLRNSRRNSTVKAEENVFAVKNEANPMHAQNPLAADTPIVFTRTDGSEIVVKPSEIVEQTAKLVQQAITENKEQNEYSLVLNPEEMGRITVKMMKAADGAVTVTIAAENARTQRLLETHSELMQNNLRSNGVDLESWQTVGENEQQHAAQDYQGSAKNPYYRQEEQKHTDDNGDDKSFADLITTM